MKKRVISLLLCILMLASTCLLGACSDKTLQPPPQVLDYPPITIYGIKQPGTTDAAIEKVELALSEISIRKHGVRIDLLLFEEEEYASIVFAKAQSAMSTYNTQVNEVAASPEDDSLKLLHDVVYPESVKVATDIPSDVVNANMDIFLVYTPDADSPVLNPENPNYDSTLRNAGMFETLYEQKALLGLDSYLKSGNYSALKTNAYPQAIKYVQRESYKSQLNTAADRPITNDTYAIPNNYVYGGYQFIMFDDRYVDKVYTPDDKQSLATLNNGKDSNALIALELELNALKEKGEIAADVEVRKEFSSYDEFNEYVRLGGKFCFGTIDGDLSVKTLCEQSGLYDVYKRSTDTIKAWDLCQSMFCISPSTMQKEGKVMSDKRLKQALDVLILLNTDDEFRNIFQYGVKDTHYNLGKDGVAHITGMPGDKYIMNPKYCGNMFIIYPSDNMDTATQLLASNKWYLGKLQANEVVEQLNAG